MWPRHEGCALLLVQVLHAEGSVVRHAPERVALLRYSPSGSVLACQSAGKALEFFRCGWPSQEDEVFMP